MTKPKKSGPLAKPKPKKAGRPPKPPGELRNITIPVLVTKAEAKALATAGKTDGLSPAQYLRKLGIQSLNIN